MRVTIIETDDDNWFRCDYCGALTSLDDARAHGDDFTLCPDCSGAFVARLKACHHEWEPELARDEYGDAGHCCRRCGWFIDVELAMSLMPFVCDGYVPVEGDAA